MKELRIELTDKACDQRCTWPLLAFGKPRPKLCRIVYSDELAAAVRASGGTPPAPVTICLASRCGAIRNALPVIQEAKNQAGL